MKSIINGFIAMLLLSILICLSGCSNSNEQVVEDNSHRACSTFMVLGGI